MKPAFNLLKSRRTAAGNWLVAAILAFVLLITVLPGQGQPQAKIDSLLNVIKNAPEDTTLALNLKNLGCSYGDISKYELALQYGDSALALSEKLNFPKGLASAHLCISNTHFWTGDYEKAKEHCMIARDISAREGFRKTEAASLTTLAAILLSLDDLDAALKNAKRALEIGLEINYQTVIRYAYNSIGVVYGKQGNYPEALKVFLAYLEIAEKSENQKDLLLVYDNLANIYGELENYQEAKNYTQKFYSLAKESGNESFIAKAYRKISSVLSGEGMHREAIIYNDSALKIAIKIDDKSAIKSCYNNNGVSYLELGNYQAARENFISALEISENIGSKSGISLAYGNLGKVSLFLGEYHNSRIYLEEGLSVAKSIGYNRDIAFNYQWLYALDSAVGNYKQAFEHYKSYKLYQDSLNGEESSRKIEQLKIQYETEKKDQEIELLNKDNEIKSLQLSKQKAIRHGMIAGIVLLFVTGFVLFRSFRLRKKLEQQQAIISERKRISADLHDDVGSGLSRIMLLTELVKREARTPEMKQEAEKIAKISRELSSNISEIIWALNANNDTLESLVAYIRRHAAEFFEDSGLQFRINTPAGIADIPLSGEKRRDIFYTVKEALHNIHKHAQATEAELSFTLNEGELSVVVRDNGRGIPEEAKNDLGNGLHNMRQRMESVGGSFNIENHQGTKITLKVPVP